MEGKEIKRRDFLKQAGIIAGAGVLASSPWLKAVAGEPGVARSKVKLGIIGVGSRGRLLATYLLQNPGVEIAAFCDDYEPHFQRAQKMFGEKAKGFYDYRELLKMGELQGILIATPLFEHARMSIDSMSAGKHVFCEKAMAYSADQCLDMYNTHRDTGKILHIGHQRLFNIRFLKAVEMIREGKLGEIQQIRAYWHRFNNWRRNAPEGLERKINWRLYDEYSRGLMTELASHQIQAANWALGEIPESVSGSGSIRHWKDGREVYDNVNLVYRYPSGTHLIYDSMTSNKKYGCEQQVMGPKGTLEMEAGKFFTENPPAAPGIVKLINNIEKNIFDVIPVGGASWVPDDPSEDKGEFITEVIKSDGTQAMLEAFVNSVRDNKPIEGITEEGYNAAVASLLGHQAMKEGSVIEWPDKYRI